MLFSCGWWHLHRSIRCAWLFGESSVGSCVSWIALYRVIGTSVVGKTGFCHHGTAVWLVQSLIGLQFAALVGSARREPYALTCFSMHALVLPSSSLCMAWSVACAGPHRGRAWPVGPCELSHHRPRTIPPEWRVALRCTVCHRLWCLAIADLGASSPPCAALVCATGNHS
ncbi:hypothetical protein V6N13_061301 [Hibiscus sabdariffa]